MMSKTKTTQLNATDKPNTAVTPQIPETYSKLQKIEVQIIARAQEYRAPNCVSYLPETPCIRIFIMRLED